MSLQQENSLIAGSAGRLQVLESRSQEAPKALAIICHPHPLHGGTLDNKIVHQLAKSFVELGAVSVRFNFRGVGQSEGEYDEGKGERDDLISVVKWARQRWPGLPLWLAGFSFGGFIALDAAQTLLPDRLVTVAPAVNYFPEQPVLLDAINWLLIHGDADDIVPWSVLEAWIGQQELKPEVVCLEGAGHFFHGRLNELRDIVLRVFSDDECSARTGKLPKQN
ncbi:Hydrolase, alpha/beta fold family [hydrothermal vent metagenome]|uniref:Hydrolase, alpha/beta fold family n=1 Tax=hydrothermal vent metagenome TaxID=652676 RepID=A0A3B0YSQ6_9ZZZZ